MLDGPAGDFIMARKPDLWEALHVVQQLTQHRGHQRPTAEVRMDRQVDQRHRFTLRLSYPQWPPGSDCPQRFHR